MKTIIVADNQDITHLGLLYLCNRLGNATTVAVKNKKELIQILSQDLQSVVILDYTLFDLVSVDELLILQDRFPNVFWLLFSERLSESFIKRLIVDKRTSVVFKDSSEEEIRRGIALSLNGEAFFCKQVKSMLSQSKEELQNERSLLTATEKEILKLVAMGKSTKEIAAERFSSIHTIATHRKNIFHKLDVNNVYEATKYALRAGIMDETEYYI